MAKNVRTDLAVELNELYTRKAQTEAGELKGVKVRNIKLGSFDLTSIEVLDEDGAEALGKPVGNYLTLELGAMIRREENSFVEAVSTFSTLLKELLNMDDNDSVLVVGLGNRSITPDAVGPVAIESVLVTRHLLERMPEQFGGFREVSAICTGVLGTTGIESVDIIRSICDLLHPDRVIAIDALAAMKLERLCRTVQLSDSGIVPGSGVGNERAALNRETLGVPVIAIGVPTVVEARTMISEYLGDYDPDSSAGGGMIVTPKDIDKSVSDLSRLIAYGIDIALHDGLTVGDVDMLVG